MDEQKKMKINIIRYVDEFAELYLDATIRWIQQQKANVSEIKFMLGKAPYRFPPKMVIRQKDAKLVVHSFELPYRDQTNYRLDCYASDINQWIEENPECEQLVIDRLKLHLKKIRDITRK